MRGPTGFAHRRDLVVERVPVAAQHMGAGDDDVDLARALPDRIADLLQALLQGGEPGRKAGRDGGDRNPRALERLDRRPNHGRVDADRGDRQTQVGKIEGGEKLFAERVTRFGAEPAHAPGRVVPRQCREVDAGHRLHEPRRLVFLLDGPARGQGRGAALDRARIDADALEPIGRERHARIARAIVPGQSRVGERLVHGSSRTSTLGVQRCHERAAEFKPPMGSNHSIAKPRSGNEKAARRRAQTFFGGKLQARARRRGLFARLRTPARQSQFP